MGEWELVLRTYPVHMPDRKDSNKSTVEAQTENPTHKEVNENIVATKEDNVEPQTETNGGIVEDNLEIIKPEDTSSEHNQRRSNNLMEDGTAAKLPQIEDFYEMSDTERHEYISGIEKLFDSEIDVLVNAINLSTKQFRKLDGKARSWKLWLIAFGGLLAALNASAALQILSYDINIPGIGKAGLNVVLSSLAALFAIFVTSLSSIIGALDYPTRAVDIYSRRQNRLAIARRFEVRWYRYVRPFHVEQCKTNPQGCANAGVLYSELLEAIIEESRTKSNNEDSEVTTPIHAPAPEAINARPN